VWQGVDKPAEDTADYFTVGSATRPAATLVTPEKKRQKMGSREASRVRVMNDELGKIIQQQSEAFMHKDYRTFIRDIRGRGDLNRGTTALRNHPAKPLVEHLAKRGAPAFLQTKPWGEPRRQQVLRRGPHKSCQDHLEFLRAEMLSFARKSFWTLLPYRLWRKKMLKEGGALLNTRLSPPGVIPQRDRRPRWIIDYTYYLLNQETLELGPEEAMQFGRALERILYYVRMANPRYGPVYLGKVDLADGFCRVWLTMDSIPQLAVTFPKFPGEEQLVALPLTIPMGWVESVPYFCAVTETVADLANNRPTTVALPEHPLESAALTPPPVDTEHIVLPTTTTMPSKTTQGALTPTAPLPRDATPPMTPTKAASLTPQDPDTARALLSGPEVLCPLQKPVRHTDVYVDDFMMAVQGMEPARVQHLRRLLYSIDDVFRPKDELDSVYRQHVASLKKLGKGDACLLTRKTILGWIIDTLRGTLELPPHRIARLLEIFEYLRGRDRVGVSMWRKILGELRSMSIGIPGSRGLFTLLQYGLKFKDQDRLQFTRDMADMILDFEYLAKDLGRRPTSISELVPDHPVAVGPHDASGLGMGGVWLPAVTNSNLTPILWRSRFPAEITADLVSYKNPNGSITNSDLELAGCIGQQDILVQEVNCAGRTVMPFGDNTPSVSWHHKGSASTAGPAAYLLRMNSLHQRHFRYLAKAGWISGPANQMADDCSRLWNLSDSQLLAYFNSTYPQTLPWKLVHLRPVMHSALTLALQRKRPEPQSFLNDPRRKTVTGAFGKRSSPIIQASTPTSRTSRKQSSYIFSKYSPRDYETVSSHQVASLSEVVKWKTTYAPSARRSPAWMSTTETPGMPAERSSMQG